MAGLGARIADAMGNVLYFNRVSGARRDRIGGDRGFARRRSAWSATIFAGVLLLAPALVRGADLCQGTLKKLSDCTPLENRDVVIGTPACRTVYADKSFTGAEAFRKITIQSGGALCVSDKDVSQQPNKKLTIQVSTIEVRGTLAVGSSTAPIGTASASNLVTLNFTGPKPGTLLQGQCTERDFYKGIVVCNDGILRLFGKKGIPTASNTSPSWTQLSQPAGDPTKYGATVDNKPSKIGIPVTAPDAKTITVADGVATDWQGGDWIVIGTTSFSPFETEFVQIDVINGKTITLKNSLKYYHFGSLAPDNAKSDPNCKDSKGALMPASFCQGKEYNYGVDERAEVGLISRNIKLTSDAGTATDRTHWGGEIKILEGYGETSIQGVEIEKFGKDKLGSYPVHFHVAGTIKSTQTTLVNSNSIHHSYNKCFTVHETNNVTIQNNVCARIVGHIFYEETGNENDITFQNNLGLGTMSNSFDIAATAGSNGQSRADLIKNYWWTGDNLTNDTCSPNCNSYDGFGIPNTDTQTNPVHGSCQVKTADGSLTNPTRNPDTPPSPTPPCNSGNNEIYVEPASGFWITNPGTRLIGNSIGGCQGVGRGYWYVTPANDAIRYKQVTFLNNRVHSCYDGVYDENEYTIQSSQTLNPREGGTNGGWPLIATFDGLTATRIRDRGVWLRSAWFVVTNGRFATTRDAVTLLTSGGIDGNSPGVWELLKNSVVVGLSANNVERFGPCPKDSQAGQGTGYFGKNFGCIDRTPGAADELGKGYPDYKWNFAGYMIYDGPVRMTDIRFVNFNVKPGFTAADQDFLDAFNIAHQFFPPAPVGGPFQYEGDAALGWFQANQSAYPNATITKGLRFDNVDLRHQVYTEGTGLVLSGVFNDSDKNTVVIDGDGTLSGLKVVGPTGGVVHETFPVSLNNLEFNATRLPSQVAAGTQSSVDECQSMGAQDDLFEKRPSALMIPGDIGALEFFALFPGTVADQISHHQLITFMKDSTDFGKHASMTLGGRDGRGIFEPRVISGYGYTVTAAPKTTGPNTSPKTCGPKGDQYCAGIPNWIDVGVADVVKAQIKTATPLKVTKADDSPFYVRIGICYTDVNGTHPSDSFEIRRGYKGYGGGNVPVNDDPLLNVYFNRLANQYDGQSCHDLDGSNPGNMKPPGSNGGCPADGVVSLKAVNGVTAPCPSGKKTTLFGADYCVYPRAAAPLTSVSSIDKLLQTPDSTQPTLKKPDLDKYYYDKQNGMLVFYVAQTLPNAVGPSPLGSCKGTANDPPECPNQSGESFYVCPAPGCEIAIVKLNDPGYQPGPSNCGAEGGVAPYDPAKIYQIGKTANTLGTFEQFPPDNQNQLALVTTGQIVSGVKEELKSGYPHAKPSPKPVCELIP